MIEQKNTPHVYAVGDIVRTTEPFGPNQAGSIGIVYEVYANQAQNGGAVVSVLLANGHDIGSFDEDEQEENLVWLGHVPLTYEYSSPGQLMTDYRNGYFNQALTGAKSLGSSARLTV